jgi:Flp pilus assembly pilin Flp
MNMGFGTSDRAARKVLICQRQQKPRQAGSVCPNCVKTGTRVARRLDSKRRITMKTMALRLWQEDQGQDIAEYAVMLAVILVIVVGTIRLIGSNANNVFSSVASSVQ